MGFIGAEGIPWSEARGSKVGDPAQAAGLTPLAPCPTGDADSRDRLQLHHLAEEEAVSPPEEGPLHRPPLLLPPGL